MRSEDDLAAKKAARRTYHTEWQRNWRANNPDKVARDREKNAIRMGAKYRDDPGHRAYQFTYRKARRAEWLASSEAQTREEARAKGRRSKIEILAATARWQRARYHENPNENLRRRMSAAVRKCAVSGGTRRNDMWLVTVGYTIAELRQHIERQFRPGMGWHNVSKWHIDHIVPLSSFQFERRDDPEFRAAWALTNLRPLWAAENIRKYNKREVLL